MLYIRSNEKVSTLLKISLETVSWNGTSDFRVGSSVKHTRGQLFDSGLNIVQAVSAGGVGKIYWSSFLWIFKQSCVWSRVLVQRVFLVNSRLNQSGAGYKPAPDWLPARFLCTFWTCFSLLIFFFWLFEFVVTLISLLLIWLTLCNYFRYFAFRNREKHPNSEMAKFAVFALECIKRTRPR